MCVIKFWRHCIHVCDVGRMDMRHAEKDVEIAVGVMSALAVLLAAVEAWSWARRYVQPRGSWSGK